MYSINSDVKASTSSYWKEVFQERSILVALAKRRIKVKYANTFLGLGWLVLQPLILITLLVVVFGKMADMPTENGQSTLSYVSVGLLVWIYFNSCISGSVSSAMSTQDLISKVYFPRALLPLSVSLEACIELGMMIILALIFGGFSFGLHLLLLPLFLLWLMLFVTACNHLTVMITLRFNDLRFVVPVVMRILIFITPIAYSTTVYEAKGYYWLAMANPLAGLIELARYASTGIPVDLQLLMSSATFTIVLVIIVIWSFVRFDRVIGDIV